MGEVKPEKANVLSRSQGQREQQARLEGTSHLQLLRDVLVGQGWPSSLQLFLCPARAGH